MESLRSVKDSWEIARLREAAARLSDAAKYIIPKALAGISERDMVGLIEGELQRVGFDKPAFDTIVASGPNSAIAHYRSGRRRVAAESASGTAGSGHGLHAGARRLHTGLGRRANRR